MKNKHYYSDGTILDHWDKAKTLHREGGPAVEYSNGYKAWYLNGKLYREGGPAVEYSDGAKYWYFNGSLHRQDGPAVEYPNGDKLWFLNGKYHREDGPAIEYTDGRRQWWLNNEQYTEEEYYQELNQINNLPNILKLVDPRAWVRAKYQGEAHEG